MDEPHPPGNPGSRLDCARRRLSQAPSSASPRFERDWEIRGPIEAYVPQPGDIFLASDQRLWFRWGHLICGANGLHHSGIVFVRTNGELGLIEAGPFNKTVVEVMNPYEHMSESCFGGRQGLDSPPPLSAHAGAVGAADGIRLGPGGQALRAVRDGSGS